jgi:O-antigen ligase
LAKSLNAPSTSRADERDAGISFWRGLAAEPVALGLGLLVVLRPWRDGLTFTAFNAYYFALVLALTAAWCARGLLRPVSLRSPVPVAILAAFVGVAWLTGFASYAYDPAAHGLQRLTVYLLVFALATNGLRTRRAVSIVIGAIVLGWLLNSLWTIFHYNVMLKGMRQVLRDNPLVLRQYFKVSEVTPELKHRLESNRAFGTFLFPNALGAFLILGIPVLGAVLPNALSSLRSLSGPRERPGSKHIGWIALGIGMWVAVVTLAALYFGNEFIGLARPGEHAPVRGAYRPFLFFLPVAATLGTAAGWFVRTRGAPAFGRLCIAVAVPSAFAASLIALWLSYSRGSAAALIAASGLAAALANWGRLPWKARLVRAGVASLLLVSALTLSRPGGAQEGEGYRIPEPIPSSLRYEERKYKEAAKEMRTLNIEGTKRELGSLGDLSTFNLRVTYWRVGMKMFVRNLWTGVGLGNFETAYPKYQMLGAGDVETAHNDFLQYFCETGLLGGALFLAFWVYFGVWGARRILVEGDAKTRRWLAGTYAGALGFTVHSLVDFNFQNPGLAMEAYVVAGLFYALATLDEAQPVDSVAANRRAGRIFAALLGVIALACTASVVRTYFFDLGLTEGRGVWRLYAVGDRKPMNARLEAANIVWDVLSRPNPKPGEPNPPRAVQLIGALRVVPDLKLLETIGELRAPVPESPRPMRLLKPGEAPPRDTIVFFNDLPRARQVVAEQCERRIAVVEEWDKSYPYDPEISSHIFSWYDLLFETASDPAAKRRFALEAERWAKATVDRSPQVSWWWLNYAKSLWMRGRVEPTPEARVEYYRTGLGYYRKAHELYPRSAVIASQYGQALQKLGEALAKAGRTEEGKGLLAEGQAMNERAVVLDRYDQLVR